MPLINVAGGIFAADFKFTALLKYNDDFFYSFI